MAWERLALIQAIGESDTTLQKVAEALGFESQFAIQAQKTEEDRVAPDPGGDSAATTLTTEALPTEKPHAFFLRVNRMETLLPRNMENRGYPKFLDGPVLPPEPPSPQGTYRFAPPPPLLSMSRLAPLLHQGLGQIKTTSRIDFSRMVRHIAQGKFIRRLPRIKQRRWPQQLQIIVDPRVSLEPYWSDFAFIITALKKRLGTERVTALRFDEATLGESQMQATYWPTQPQDRWFVWQLPASDVSLLILSDLGMATSDANVCYQWRQWITQLRSHAGPILTLSPALQTPQGRQLCALIKPHPLHDRVRLPRHPARKGFELTQPTAQTLSDALTWLSILPIIDTGLLRRLRTEMQWGGSELESLIWNHACFSQTSLGLRMPDSSEAQQYRAKYQQQFAQTPQAQRFWQIVHDHHAQAFEGLRQLERLSRSISEHEHDDAAQRYFQRVCATVRQTSSVSAHAQALQAQCRTALLSLPDHLFQSDQQDVAYALYAMAYQQEIQAGQWPESLKPGFEPARLQWLLNEAQAQQRVAWQVIQISAQGHFVCQLETGISAMKKSPLPSVALVTAQPMFPPTYQVSSNLSQQRGIVQSAQVFLAANNPVILETSMQRVELEAIQKPTWALRIKANRSGLSVDLPALRRVISTVPWVPGEGTAQGNWAIPAPFGLDKYGLFANLIIGKNTIQRFRWITLDTDLEKSGKQESDIKQQEKNQPRGFWIAITPCSSRLWLDIMGDMTDFHQENLKSPINEAEWSKVNTFIQRLNLNYPKLQARLPTRREWEYVFGKSIPLPEDMTLQGDLLLENLSRLDISKDNIWEWCADVYSTNSKEGLTNSGLESNPGLIRYSSGDSWSEQHWSSIPAFELREISDPNFKNRISIFRLVLDAEEVINKSHESDLSAQREL